METSTGNPYIDEGDIRTFPVNAPNSELIWHRDHNDRVVEIIEAGGWSYQMDDELPQKLENGEMVYVPKETYHRVIKGTQDLVIRIHE